jgi:hypothetical protein
MNSLSNAQETSLRSKFGIALSKFNWSMLPDRTTALATKEFPALKHKESAIIYLSPSIDDNGKCRINGEFVSKGENAMENIMNNFIPDASQEDINLLVDDYIKKAEYAISQSFACRFAS